MAPSQHCSNRFSVDLPFAFANHVANFKRWKQNHIEVIHQKTDSFPVNFINQTPNLESHARRRFAHPHSFQVWSFRCSGQQIIEMVAKANNSTEIAFTDESCTAWREKGLECAHSRIECHHATLVLGLYARCSYRNAHIPSFISANQPTIARFCRNGLSVGYVSRNRMIQTFRFDSRFRDKTTLFRVFSGSEV